MLSRLLLAACLIVTAAVPGDFAFANTVTAGNGLAGLGVDDALLRPLNTLNLLGGPPDPDPNGTNDPGEGDDDAGVVRDCDALVTLKISVTIMGQLGQPGGPELTDEEKEARNQGAGKWVFSALLRSMLHQRSAESDETDLFKLSTTARPNIDVKTVKPFEISEDGQRSPLEQTVISVDFPETDVCSAMGFGKYVCGDYDSGEEELLNGILRALDVAKSYPRQAMDAVSKAGLGPKSMIIVRVASLNSRDTIMNSCNWGARITTGAIQGALLLPDCPANSVRCEAREHLCEASEPSWKCKCTLGYDGEITIPNLDDIQGPFQIVGECKPIAGYCKFDEFKLMLASGEEAKGVLGETATPACPKGFEAAGSSECTEGQSREGRWTPIPRCNYIPPNVPPEPFCSSPQLNPTLTFKGCSICFGVEPGKTGPACDCEVHCAEDHEEVGTVGSGQKSCVATEYQCPESTMEGAQCVDAQTKEPTMDFCCDKAWGANIPPPSLTEGSCRDIKEDKQCLTSVQSATGADANKAGQPCCWSRSGFGGDASVVCAAKESQAMQGTTPSACAVARRVLKADWAQLPTCIPPCEDTFDRGFLDVSGCERCYGAEATNAPACSCQVECESSLMRIGGGPEGSRTCEAATNGEYSFGLPPACQMRPPSPRCPSVDAPGLRPSECATEAGGTCKVACERGFVRTDGGEEGEKFCRAKPKQLEVKTCEDITEEEECLNSHGQAHTGDDVWSALPCCWNKEGFGNGKKCLQSGSSVISQHSLPHACAEVAFTEWDPLPTCMPLCTMDMLRGRPNLIVDPSCETCIAGQDCDCTVQCEDGFPRIGGGLEGKRKCTPDALSLGPPPVCRAKKAGEPGQPPACPRPQVADASVDCQCKAVAEGCECPIYCTHTHGNIKADAPEGSKKCVIEEKVPPEGVCSEFTNEADCLGHTQGGEPCCFRETGLYADSNLRAVSGSVCAARYDPKMFFAPTMCSKSLFPKWEEMPECKPRCVPNLLQVANIKHEDCTDCIADQPCPCKVRCNEDGGYERVGGGSEGSRSCSASAPESLYFEEAPLCQLKEATPQCKAVPSFPSLRLSDCGGATVGEEQKCEVYCAIGHATFTDVQEGLKTCNIDPDYALKETTCRSLNSEGDCLTSAEGGMPCCWRDAGFKDSAKCAKKGSDAIGLQTPPDSCAPTKAAKMDPMPVCKMLCVNQFISEAYVDNENCDRCFVNEPCDCTVKCEVNTIQRAGDKGSKSCGQVVEDPTSFGAPLICEPREPPKVPFCDALVDTTFSYEIKGCRNCKAGDAACACEVKCAKGHKRTKGGQEGSKKCVSEIYECPVRVKWSEAAERCSEDGTGKFVDTFCCPEARKETIELDGSAACADLTEEKSCLKAEDQASKKACCWRGTGFKSGKKCAAQGSPEITDSHRAHACSNRPRILHAHFEERPVCTRMCSNPFKASWAQRASGGLPLDVKGCDTCVPGEANCACSVNCPTGSLYVGGGKEDGTSTRVCDANTGEYPLAPTCMAMPKPPSCPTPTGYGLVLKGCASCTVGRSCPCSVTCDRGLAPSEGTTGDKVCQKQAATLTEATRSTQTSRTACLSSWEGGKPCCYRSDGFSLKEGFFHGGPTCAALGSEAVQSPPEQCAALEVGIFPDLPKCLPVCATKFPLLARSYTSSGDCNKCIADQPCDCQIKCAAGYEFLGGKSEGKRSCTFAKPFLELPPVCSAIQPLECTRPAEEMLQNTELDGCSRCVAGSDRCRCSARCRSGHIVMPGSTAQPGPKRCLVVDAPTDSRKCEDIKHEKTCVSTVYASADGPVPCCWQPMSEGGGSCLHRGSRKIFKRSGIQPTCAKLQSGQFEEFPKCVERCHHFFDDFPFLVFNQQACDSCTPVRYPGQQDCACSVACNHFTERVGGGPVSTKRKCSPDSLMLGAPPACMAVPPKPECPRPDALGLKVQGCRGCHGGEEDCHCSLSCLPGHRVTSGSLGSYTCKEEDATGDLKTAQCSDLNSAQECLGAKEGELLCCWRKKGFTNGKKCAAKGSSDITADAIPDACAKATVGRFRPTAAGAGTGNLPVCTPTCPNIFDQIRNIDITGSCDDCEPGKDCDCEVYCTKPLKALAGNEGIRRCTMKGPLAEFEPAPDCVQPCATPDHYEGTLDVSKCKNDCVPGDEDCKCEVYCARGNVRVGGGQEGAKRCSATSRGPLYQKLPDCRPKCAAPDSQFDSLNVRQCASCVAGAACNCVLNCFTKASSSGAREGPKMCKFIPGKEGSPAASIWVAADGHGPDGVPQCLPPMRIQVQDARTQQPLSDVLIRVYVPYSAGGDRLREIQVLNTKDSQVSDFSVEFSSEARDLTVKIEKDGYTSIYRKLDRGKNCKDAFKCRFQFSLSEKLAGGVLYPEGCFIVGEPTTMEWDMRAVLEWDEKPGDLDIWARNWNCYRQVEEAYHCTGKKPHTLDPTDTSIFSGRRRTLCKRTLFTQSNVNKNEYKVCGAGICKELKNAQTAFTRRRGSVADCFNRAHNQYPKWVFWSVRHMKNLHLRWKRKNILEQYLTDMTWIGSPAYKDYHGKVWTKYHYMLLDIDKRTGFGPETMTFKNVPPGIYQVVVNQFSSTGVKPELEKIAKANPRVNLYIGGNSIAFECMIPVECRQPSRIWNVVNIQVKDLGPLPESTTGEHKFSIRLADRAEDMIRLKWVDLPTDGDTGKDRYAMDYFYPSKDAPAGS